MARKEKTASPELRRGEKVVASVAMPGIPEGTPGKVAFVEGFTWIRYWVRFGNGVVRGSIDRRKLARPQEWIDIQARRARGEDESEQPVADDAGDDGAGDAASEATGGAAPVVNGVAVPSYLIDRAKNRRQALGK